MPISANKIITCKECGKDIGTVRPGDALTSKQGKVLLIHIVQSTKLRKL